MALLPNLLVHIRRLNAVPAAARRLFAVDGDAYVLGHMVPVSAAGVAGGWSATTSTREVARLRRPAPTVVEHQAPPLPVPAVTRRPRPLTPARATERVETKYCVPPDVADSVMRLSREFLEPDANQPASGFQTVTSLYLDTRDCLFLQWTLDRLQDRFKLRLRTYGDGPPASVFAEIKSKVQGMVRKQRVEVPFEAVGILLDEPRASDTPGPAMDCRLDEFLWRLRRFGAEAKVLIRCERFALRGCYAGDETAVTIDRQLQYQPASNLEGRAWAWQAYRMPQRVGADGIVLELKHGSQAPAWMAELKGRLQPWRRSYSKYARAMTQMSLWECS